MVSAFGGWLPPFKFGRARDPDRTKPSMAPKGKKRAAPSAPASEWAAVPDAASDSDVLKAVMEVQRFWIHGDTVC